MFYPLAVLPFDIETAAISGVAGGRAVLLDLDDDGVGIAVGQHLDHVLGVTRFLALHPIFIAGTTEEPGFTVLKRQVEGFFVHEGHHQYLTILMVLNYGRDQAAHLVKIDLDHAMLLEVRSPAKPDKCVIGIIFSKQRENNSELTNSAGVYGFRRRNASIP